jgi:hypothetical protein
MQVAIKNKIPKIISGIVCAISLIALGWLFLPLFWFWVSLEIVAAALVAIGCSGEWWLHHHPAGREKIERDEHLKLESRFIAMVSYGVIIELFALGHSIKEGKQLEDKVESGKVLVAAIGMTNAQLVTDNLVLRSNVVALELQVLETSNNVVKDNPLNQPIKSIDAEVYLFISGTNFIEDQEAVFPARIMQPDYKSRNKYRICEACGKRVREPHKLVRTSNCWNEPRRKIVPNEICLAICRFYLGQSCSP